MSKRKKVILSVIFCIVFIVLSILGISWVSKSVKTIYIDNVKFNTDTLHEDLNRYVRDNKPVFEEAKLNKFVDYSINEDEINNRNFIDFIVAIFKPSRYKLNYTYTFDKDRIKKYLEDYNKKSFQSENAYITKSKGKFKIVHEVYGSEVDIDKLLNNLKCDYKIIKLDDYRTKPEVTRKDLVDELEKINKFVKWSCKYKNGKEIKSSIDYVDFKENEIKLNTDWIYKYIYNCTKSFNTVGIKRNFVTHNNKKITVSGGTWGSLVDTDREFEYLVDAFKKGKSIKNRVPIYNVKREKVGKTYIEVSLKEQYVWVYKNGKCIMKSPCVTGDISKKHGTPKGMYFISECINGKYLTGDGYKTWVNKWMRLTYTGVGLHDAYWRGAFGGNIYKTNGSHGCVNLPKDFAYKLYKKAYVGMPVIIY